MHKTFVSLAVEIAIISPVSVEGNYEYEKKFLSSYFPNIWTKERLESNAFQVHQGMDVAKSLLLITTFYQVDPSCAVLISGHYQNEMDAERLGMLFMDVKPVGLTTADLELIETSLKESCSNPTDAANRPCTDSAPDPQYTCARQKKWGKCEEGWMSEYCCYTCHGCKCGLIEKKIEAPEVDKSVVGAVQTPDHPSEEGGGHGEREEHEEEQP